MCFDLGSKLICGCALQYLYLHVCKRTTVLQMDIFCLMVISQAWRSMILSTITEKGKYGQEGVFPANCPLPPFSEWKRTLVKLFLFDVRQIFIEEIFFIILKCSRNSVATGLMYFNTIVFENIVKLCYVKIETWLIFHILMAFTDGSCKGSFQFSWCGLCMIFDSHTLILFTDFI